MSLETSLGIDFWNERWKKGETGFHQAELNPYLGYYYGEKGSNSAQRKRLRVFVPLCGKSLDMYWLSSNGYAVVGVECSELAIKSFFESHELSYQLVEYEKHVKYVHEGNHETSTIEILLGDFFDLKHTDLGDITDIYDRAALIALPQKMRRSYVKKLTALQRPKARSLLVALNYKQHEMDGPPFSVSDEEIDKLYGCDYKIEKLAEREVLEDEAKFKQRGLTALTETAYKLTRL